MNILLIDDDNECLESLSSALRLNGFHVSTFASPDTALRSYNPKTTDVVITDYHLPDSTGADVLRKIHRKKRNAPVIIISGDEEHNIESLSISAGAYAFFRKPLNVKDIIAKIKAIKTK